MKLKFSKLFLVASERSEGKKIKFKREGNAYFIKIESDQHEGDINYLKITYLLSLVLFKKYLNYATHNRIRFNTKFMCNYILFSKVKKLFGELNEYAFKKNKEN